MRLGKRPSQHYGAWLPWPLYRVSEDGDGWLLAEPGAASMWDGPLSSYVPPGKKRRNRKPPAHMRFAEEAVTREGALQFGRDFGLPDLPPFHALADGFEDWGQAPGWTEKQRQIWQEMRGPAYGWSNIKFRLLAKGLDIAQLRQAPVMVFGPWVQLVARLQAALNHLALAISTVAEPEVPRGIVTHRLAQTVGASPAGEAELREACHGVTGAAAALLEWAEPHWALMRDASGDLRLCLLPACHPDLARVLEHESFTFGTFGPTVDTRGGVWGWLRRVGLTHLEQGGALAPPYAGAVAERDQSVAYRDPWPDCSWLAFHLLQFRWQEGLITQGAQFLPDMPRRSYLAHALHVLTAFATWDLPTMALPTRKPYLSLRQAMLGMASRDAFGGWWVRCADLEHCGKVLFAPEEGRWYHAGCGAAHRWREHKRRARNTRQ